MVWPVQAPCLLKVVGCHNILDQLDVDLTSFAEWGSSRVGDHLTCKHAGPFDDLRVNGNPCPDPFRTDQPEGRVLGEPLGIVEVFVTSQAAIDGLPQQVGEGIPPGLN
jgi:hypothetical protein